MLTCHCNTISHFYDLFQILNNLNISILISILSNTNPKWFFFNGIFHLSLSLEEASMSSPARSPTGPNTSMTPHHTGSIQLWQFLQELLLQPDSYNYCIRFLDRSQGKQVCFCTTIIHQNYLKLLRYIHLIRCLIWIELWPLNFTWKRSTTN